MQTPFHWSRPGVPNSRPERIIVIGARKVSRALRGRSKGFASRAEAVAPRDQLGGRMVALCERRTRTALDKSW
jgi:hypothetical protein